MASEGKQVRSFVELCAALDETGVEGFEEWLERVHDEPDWAHCETDYDADKLRTIIFHTWLDNVDFELTFPCTLDDVWSEVHKMEETVLRHQAACHLDAEAFGAPGEDDDATDVIAKMLFVTESDLVRATGGPWIEYEGAPSWSFDGTLIYHWFGRGEPASVLIGFGGDNVYVEPVVYSPDGTPEIEEWPQPATANILFAEAENHPMAETEFLTRLSDSIAEAEKAAAAPVPPKPRRKRRRMGDHDVRLTTKNLRVAGIDLDFDVKVDGLVLGTMSVSEGGLLWRPANYQKKRGIPISWAEFAEFAESEPE